MDVFFENVFFIIGTAYAGKSTMVKELAKSIGVSHVKKTIMTIIPECLMPKNFPV